MAGFKALKWTTKNSTDFNGTRDKAITYFLEHSKQ